MQLTRAGYLADFYVSAFSCLKRLHAIHHHRDAAANFGVTSPLWDHVFRTRTR